jgi:hypothetical protein
VLLSLTRHFIPLRLSIMSTQTHTSTQEVPELTVLHRVASIPLVCSSLETINGALSSNVLTRQPYSTAKGLSTTAYRYTEPLQIRLAPLIERANGIANKAVDAVESRYPYPFKAKPEDVASLVRESRQNAMNVYNKAIDEKIKSPAIHMAEGIDHVRHSLTTIIAHIFTLSHSNLLPLSTTSR